MNKVVLYKKTEEILELMQIKTGKNKAVLVNEIIQNFHKPDTIPVIFYVPEESIDNLEEWFSDRAGHGRGAAQLRRRGRRGRWRPSSTLG